MSYENLQAYLSQRAMVTKKYPFFVPDSVSQLTKQLEAPALEDISVMLTKDGGTPLRVLDTDTYTSKFQMHNQTVTLFVSLNMYKNTSRPVTFFISSDGLTTKQSKAYGAVKSIERELHNAITNFDKSLALQLKVNQEKADIKSRQASTVTLSVDGYDKSVTLTSAEFVAFGHENASYLIELLTMTTPEIIDRAIAFKKGNK